MVVVPLRRPNRSPPPRRPRRRSRRTRDPRSFLLWVIALSVAGLLALPYAGDALTGALRRPVGALPASCQVLSVVDGDTVKIWCPGLGAESARLLGFDTPEVFSPHCASEWLAGQQATWALRLMLWQASEISLVKQGRDRYDRALVTLFVDGEDVARRMIAEGHGRAYSGGRRAGWC